MAALIIYLLAGIGFAWSYQNDEWWQRVLLVALWLPMIAWGMFAEFLDWYRRQGYHYDESDPDDPMP